MAKKCGTLRIWYEDERETEFNESLELEWPLYLDDVDDELLSIEKIRYYAIAFARAQGFTEKTIEDWFGAY